MKRFPIYTEMKNGGGEDVGEVVFNPQYQLVSREDIAKHQEMVAALSGLVRAVELHFPETFKLNPQYKAARRALGLES